MTKYVFPGDESRTKIPGNHKRTTSKHKQSSSEAREAESENEDP
jgi:hypothetical protein